MPEREPEAWETSKPGPYITMQREHGTVTLTAEGEQPGSVVVRATGRIEHEETVIGHKTASELADKLAEQLGDRA